MHRVVCGEASTCPAIGTPVCCEGGGNCYGGFDYMGCSEQAYTPVGGSAVCDASGTCVAAPGSPGDCCELNFGCANFGSTQCASYPGTYFNSAICNFDGSCS